MEGALVGVGILAGNDLGRASAHFEQFWQSGMLAL
jgi:hypothetical protein